MGKFYKISPGGLGYQWRNWLSLELAAVGFSMRGQLGEISQYKNLDELILKYQSLGVDRPHQSARQLWRFARDVQIGDFLVAYKLYHILDIGVV
ncbi:MAG: hypothetical protein ACTSRQ_09145, partial [Candidatus Thorarchaeota archaeon]